MTGITVSDIARITGGRLSGDGGAAVSSAVIDSREASEGSMFLALPGEKADGHSYIGKAFEMGAACCLALRVPDGETRPVIVVPDVAAALKDLAEQYRARFDIPVVGIAGSVGKTTAKEMTAAVLGSRLNVLKTEKNLNNELGVPLTLLRLAPEHQAAVVEMGISDFGEMSRLAKMVRPDMAVYTVIGHAHLEKLGDRNGVLRAKTELVDFMPAGGTVFVNGDDDLLYGYECSRKKLCFGTGGHNDVRAENIVSDDSGTRCDIAAGSRRIPAVIQAYGQHMVYAALAGASVGIKLGLTDEEIASGIASYRTVGRRASVLDTGFVTLIDDCYNANPDSMKCALDSMAKLSGRKVCILGDMLELGGNSPALHRAVGEYAAENGAGLIMTVGPMAENISAGAVGKGVRSEHFSTVEELISALPGCLRAGDTVLVKASHSMKFENISEAIKTIK